MTVAEKSKVGYSLRPVTYRRLKTPEAFQDIQKLDKFVTKCNLLFEDPYLQDDYPSHDDAITARQSVAHVDEYLRQHGFISVHSKRLREIIDHVEREDWGRVSTYIKDANKEFTAINKAYNDSARHHNESYSKLSSHDTQRHLLTSTRLSKIEERASRMTRDNQEPTAQIVNYVRSSSNVHNKNDNGNSIHTDSNGRSHSSHQSDTNHYAVHSQRHGMTNQYLPHSHKSHMSDHRDIHSHRSWRSQHQEMDEELRRQLHLSLDFLDQSDARENDLPDPENVGTERTKATEQTQGMLETSFRQMVLDENTQMEPRPAILNPDDRQNPNKIAESFSRMYDDIWTEACDELSRHYHLEPNGERQAILDLASILKASFSFTAKHFQTQTERIAHQIREMMLDPCSDKKHEDETNPFRHDAILRRHTENSIRDTADLCISPLQRHFISHGFPRHLASITKLPTVKRFAESCIELTWLMQAQDPPMFMLWPDMCPKENIVHYFRYCTATGTVLDHEVWPALFLYGNGPLAVKGVAQFKE